MRENLWKPSKRAETSPVFQELVHQVTEVMKKGKIDEPDLYAVDSSGFGLVDDDLAQQDLDAIATELESMDTSCLAPEEHRSVTKLLSMENPQWGHGEITREDDQLFEVKGSAVYEPADVVALKALVGITGDRILGVDKAIDQVSGKIANTVHKRRILLGTAGLIAASDLSRLWEGEYAGFDNTDANGIASRVEVFADFHGDFRIRETYRTDRILDPIGREQSGAPAIEPIYVGGYHSVEPYVLMNVLFHQAQRMEKATLQQFADDILQRIYNDNTLEVKVGAFGDWGSADGAYEAHLLRELMNEGSVSSISESRVLPLGDEKFVIESTIEGIVLSNAISGEEKSAILVTNDKIEDFIVTLVKSSFDHGRTGPAALLNILDTVRGDDGSWLL